MLVAAASPVHWFDKTANQTETGINLDETVVVEIYVRWVGFGPNRGNSYTK